MNKPLKNTGKFHTVNDGAIEFTYSKSQPDINEILSQIWKQGRADNWDWKVVHKAKQALYHRLAAEAVTMRMVNVMNEDISLAQPALPISKLKAIMEVKE